MTRKSKILKYCALASLAIGVVTVGARGSSIFFLLVSAALYQCALSESEKRIKSFLEWNGSQNGYPGHAEADLEAEAAATRMMREKG
jgi:hypothetical protein